MKKIVLTLEAKIPNPSGKEGISYGIEYSQSVDAFNNDKRINLSPEQKALIRDHKYSLQYITRFLGELLKVESR